MKIINIILNGLTNSLDFKFNLSKGSLLETIYIYTLLKCHTDLVPNDVIVYITKGVQIKH